MTHENRNPSSSIQDVVVADPSTSTTTPTPFSVH